MFDKLQHKLLQLARQNCQGKHHLKLTLQGVWVYEMDGAGYTNTHTNLVHISQALCQFWRQTDNIILDIRTNI